MRDGRQLAEAYRDLFAQYCVELDCWTTAIGHIVARECGLSSNVDDTPALSLPNSFDIDGILHSAARGLGVKLIKHAARAFAPTGGRPLHIKMNDFSNYWNRQPQNFDPVALWEALEQRFSAQPAAQIPTQTIAGQKCQPANSPLFNRFRQDSPHVHTCALLNDIPRHR